jgi:DNA-nicking Smr family endonuclease
VTRKNNKKGEPSGGAFEALRDLRDKLAREPAQAPPPKAPAAPSKPRPPKRAEDDAKLLRRAYAGVQPLDRSRGPRPRHPTAAQSAEEAAPNEDALPSGRRDEADVRERLRTLALDPTPFEVSDEGDRVEGRRTDVPLDLLRRLRRGYFPVDARLDLHGMVAGQARVRLEVFLRTMRGRHERAVLVIHGKGEHSPMGLGVLRGEISAWLSQGASSEHVAAFATARDHDGGAGAVYVLLRR